MLLNEFQYSARLFLFATFPKNRYGSRMSKRKKEIRLSCDDSFFCFDVFSHFEMFEFIFALICVFITFLQNIFIESLTMRIITKRNSRSYFSLLFLLFFFLCVSKQLEIQAKNHTFYHANIYIHIACTSTKNESYNKLWKRTKKVRQFECYRVPTQVQSNWKDGISNIYTRTSKKCKFCSCVVLLFLLYFFFYTKNLWLLCLF